MSHQIHYADPYLLNPQHPITVTVVGCGGTGSHVMQSLGELQLALVELGHVGLHVTAYDGKAITRANRGRTTFSPFDEGANKAITLVTRINRFFGTRWEAVPADYSLETIKSKMGEFETTNITISCVDTIQARHKIQWILSQDWDDRRFRNREPSVRPIYWLDFGNLEKTGQVLLSTVNDIKQPSSGGITWLPNIFEKFPSIANQTEDDNLPSCTVAQALGRQGLFVNSILARLGVELLGSLFCTGHIDRPGLFMNLKTGKTAPMSFDAPGLKKLAA